MKKNLQLPSHIEEKIVEVFGLTSLDGLVRKDDTGAITQKLDYIWVIILRNGQFMWKPLVLSGLTQYDYNSHKRITEATFLIQSSILPDDTSFLIDHLKPIQLPETESDPIANALEKITLLPLSPSYFGDERCIFDICTKTKDGEAYYRFRGGTSTILQQDSLKNLVRTIWDFFNQLRAIYDDPQVQKVFDELDRLWRLEPQNQGI